MGTPSWCGGYVGVRQRSGGAGPSRGRAAQAALIGSPDSGLILYRERGARRSAGTGALTGSASVAELVQFVQQRPVQIGNCEYNDDHD